MDIQDLCARCLNGADGQVITPSMAYTYVKSPFSLWCEFHGPEDAKDPLSRFQKLLFEEGGRHERSVVAHLYPDAEPVEWDEPEEGFRLTVQIMSSGGPAVHGAPLFFLPDGLHGVVDLIERVDGRESVFGDFHYVVKEIKSAKNIGDEHRLQAAMSNYLLGKVQGHTPSRYYVIDREGEHHEYEYDEDEVAELVDRIRDIQAGEAVDPIYGGAIWPWESHTNELAIDAKDVSLIGGVGRKRRERLRAGGYMSVELVAEASPDELQQIHGIGPATGHRLVNAARAMEEESHIRIGEVNLPGCTTEVFFDLEGTAHQAMNGELVDMDYMIGALVRREGEEEFQAFVAHGIDDEGRMFREFMEWVTGLRDAHLFHWHNYENWRLKRMSQRYGKTTKVNRLLLERTTDLHGVATDAFAFPTHSNSIKSVASYMGFEWQHEDVSATESVAMYFEYLEDPDGNEAVLDKIVDYNRDDCVATRVVKDWLAERVS